MTFGGLLYLAAIVLFILSAAGLWVFEMELIDGVALIATGLACFAAAGLPWWASRRL